MLALQLLTNTAPFTLITPPSRVGIPHTPADVAALTTFLASNDSAFITGEIYKIDGGRMSKLSLP